MLVPCVKYGWGLINVLNIDLNTWGVSPIHSMPGYFYKTATKWPIVNNSCDPRGDVI